MGSKPTCIRQEDFPINEMHICKISKWEVMYAVSQSSTKRLSHLHPSSTYEDELDNNMICI